MTAVTKDCEHPCIETPVAVHPTPCYQIEPCNDGCVELYDPACINVGSLLIVPPSSLQEVISNLERGYLNLAFLQNQVLPVADRLVTLRIKNISTYLNVPVTLFQGSTSMISGTFINLSSMVAIFQTFEPGIMLDGDDLVFKATETWSLTRD